MSRQMFAPDTTYPAAPSGFDTTKQAPGARMNVGVVPTPAVARIGLVWDANAGVVISASHNPFEDNGIKFFGGNGKKLPDCVEDEIEALLHTWDDLPRPWRDHFQCTPPAAKPTDWSVGVAPKVGRSVGR